MATRTKPLITAAALASVAAIAVASPALAPNLTPTPAALSAAQVELTTFSDLLSVPASEWSNVYFTGWGGAITPINASVPDYWLPSCNNNCTIGGVSGIAYLALDALVNGDGKGWNAANPGTGWNVSALNYFFEGGTGGSSSGLSAGLQYLTEYPFLGTPYRTPGPLYNPTLSSLIALAWEGPVALTTIYVQALSTIAVLAKNIPLIGEYLFRGIGSYIGPNFQTIDDAYVYSNYAGVSGVLRYIGGVITTGGNPNPYPTPPTPPASVASVQSVAAAATSVVDAPSTGIAAGTVARAARAAVEAPKAGDTKSAAAASTDATPVSTGSADAASTGTASDIKPDTTPADTTPAVDSPSNAVADSTPVATKPAEAPAKASRQQRPVRNAVERATKKIASAIGGAAAKAAPAAGASADAGSSAG